MVIYVAVFVNNRFVCHTAFLATDTYVGMCLDLRHTDPILVILCTGLPITTILAGKWLNSLIWHGNIKCITANT